MKREAVVAPRLVSAIGEFLDDLNAPAHVSTPSADPLDVDALDQLVARPL